MALIWVISIVILFITPLITTHRPASNNYQYYFGGFLMINKV